MHKINVEIPILYLECQLKPNNSIIFSDCYNLLCCWNSVNFNIECIGYLKWCAYITRTKSSWGPEAWSKGVAKGIQSERYPLEFITICSTMTLVGTSQKMKLLARFSHRNAFELSTSQKKLIVKRLRCEARSNASQLVMNGLLLIKAIRLHRSVIRCWWWILKRILWSMQYSMV